MSPDAFAVRDGKLFLRWREREVDVSARKLRANCRCADCRSRALKNSNAQSRLDAPSSSAIAVDIETAIDIAIDAVTPIGYGLQLHFSDGHNRGIYPWSYLYELSESAALVDPAPSSIA